MTSRTLRASALAGALALIFTQTATAQSPSDRGRAFDPQPVSPAVYDQSAPAYDTKQVQWITARDGRRLYLETWLPVARPGGPRVPKKIPTVLYVTPYQSPSADPK